MHNTVCSLLAVKVKFTNDYRDLMSFFISTFLRRFRLTQADFQLDVLSSGLRRFNRI